jgi:hypothetical protein
MLVLTLNGKPDDSAIPAKAGIHEHDFSGIEIRQDSEYE